MQLLILRGFTFEGDDYLADTLVEVEDDRARRILHNFSQGVLVATFAPGVTLEQIDILDATVVAAPQTNREKAKRGRPRKTR